MSSTDRATAMLNYWITFHNNSFLTFLNKLELLCFFVNVLNLFNCNKLVIVCG